MKTKHQKLASPEEINLLEGGDLSPEEIFVLGFLKSFDRENMKAWSREELAVFQKTYYF